MPLSRVLLGGVALVALAACLYDPDHRCGSTKRLDGNFCFCPEGQIDDGHDHCVACGANEEAKANQCVCAAGFSRPAAGRPCAPSTGLGDACDTTSKPCPAGDYTHCQVTAGTAGYCTSTGCAATSDCPKGWACRKDAQPSFCARPPLGQGKACTTAADCAGTEATYCESNTLKQCLVEGCDPMASNCFDGYRCCDLTKLGLAKQLCLPTASCP